MSMKKVQTHSNESSLSIITFISIYSICVLIIIGYITYITIPPPVVVPSCTNDIIQLQIRCDKLEKALKTEQNNSIYNTVEHRLMNIKITQLEKQINNINDKDCVSYEMILALLPELENISIKIEPVFVGPLFTIENKILPSPPKPILPPSLNYCEPRLIGKLLRR